MGLDSFMGTSKQKKHPYFFGALAGIITIIGVYLQIHVLHIDLYPNSFLPGYIRDIFFVSKNIPAIDWRVIFVSGICIGSFLSSKYSGTYKSQAIPPMWANHFGTSKWRRWRSAFLGGLIMMVGEQISGVTLGDYGFNSSFEFSLYIIVSAGCFFIGGSLMARLLYGKRG